MSLQASTLRPGLLVSLKTTIKGNVAYAKTTLENAHLTDDGAQRARWETERTVVDPAEFERAKTLRSRCRTLVAGVCSNTSFGLLCPETRAPELEKGIAEARALADAFNAESNVSELGVFVITGRVSPDDVEAIRSINNELRELLDEMETGIAKLDVEAIRAAANRARSIGSMLQPDAASRLKTAINSARSAARKISKAGETASKEVNSLAIAAITEARTSFLDMDEASTDDVSLPEAEGRALDLAPEEQEGEAPSVPEASAPAFELDGTSGQARESYSDDQDRDSYAEAETE